ncbi:diguanylate cyclase (GGDEF)-like protein [Arthrobacter sp. V4I6]|uniref:GGDEF domain-containing protein n=1 Tax=unclassified Arthrobacter TaxID=235627 RepID=UPI0027836EB0|nr:MULTISPECIES: GGDEF domain-containing protein [unclassified Arthrobacter]MDQ0823224.1 diguanylate cyclase (GGDEF)-like protein [Arthrobacter sp. V1I7]MDQ0852855.1 diguanylate cyclase (GGDEF)-like protein [Arthrobacter sp. V4I6]
MMLDTATLRVALAVVDLTLLLLFYFITFRRTRSAYSGWWCMALLLFLSGNAAYLFDGSVHQVWANPSGNVLLVAGAASIWAGARSLRTTVPKAWLLAVAPAITAVASVLDQPATNIWAGGPSYLASMGVLIGLACRELFLLDRNFSRVHRTLAVGAGILSVFYLGRLVAFLADGPEGPVFHSVFGSVTTTLFSAVILVVASFTMAELSNEQLNQDLRARATFDGLTGLLNRAAFLELAEHELRRLNRVRTTGSLVLADLDHFKAINDEFGHSAGDTALQAFADACKATVRATDLVGRYGGEEFILLLPGVTPEVASDIAAEISRRLETWQSSTIPRLPTVSYGIAATSHGRAELPKMVAAADAALYQAKSLGRDRSVLASHLEEKSA